MKTIIVIPTYNEAENIERLLGTIFDLEINSLSVLVIDDNSPDGTAAIVKRLLQSNPRIHLLERESKLGLGTAYCKGFKYALQNGYNYIMEMDADFSHDPKEIKNFLEQIKDYDLVIGSRYVVGVNVINWPLSRLLLSYFANFYTRMITRLPVKDSTGGYKCFRREALESIDLEKIHSDGYAFQIEINYKIWKNGFRIKEIPIIFADRVAGISKMSKRIIKEAAWIVWKLKILSLLGKLK
ncbi:polyprenol monophosphomannose synthase [candidate division KSB1 bacterium]|nr:polyprenol monophosphomannose synthase [candidate division KSB1 bacterium]